MTRETTTGPTPGPWVVLGGDCVMGPDGAWVAHVNRGRYCGEPQGWTRPEGTANAALITAAPDLLAALREVADAHEALLREYGKPWGWGRLPVETARSAIARAEGRIA